MPEHRWVVWTGPKGLGKNAEVELSDRTLFRRDIPVRMAEPSAKELVELAELKANEVKVPLPPHFRYATATEARKSEAAEKKAADAVAAATATAAEPAEEAPEEEA